MEKDLSRKITLNEYLVFEPDKKTISHKDRKTTIGASASMCPELLIENVGRLVTHQQFYDYVWRRFGTEPASTSIYQNISALRRALIKIGYEEDIIRTMPRKGFLLSPKTTIMKENIGVSLSFTDQSEATQKSFRTKKIMRCQAAKNQRKNQTQIVKNWMSPVLRNSFSECPGKWIFLCEEIII